MRKTAKKTERSPAAGGLPFDWMDYHVPDAVLERNADHRLAMQQDDVRVRASLLRRLGWPREHALHRCLGNQEWASEMHGECPLSKDETRTLVKAAYDR